MTSIVQQGSSFGSCPTFPSPNPYSNTTFGSFDLVSSPVWWEAETNITTSQISLPLLFMSPCFWSKLYPGLKRSGALISRADRRDWVDIATVYCGTSNSREDCHCGVDIATVNFWTGGFSGITVSGVWIGTRGAVSGCGGNLDSIYSYSGLFTGVGDIGLEEQMRAFMWSWWSRIIRPSCNFIKKDRASIPPPKHTQPAIWSYCLSSRQKPGLNETSTS